MAETEFTGTDIDNLSEKVNSLELSEPEQALLATLLAFGGVGISDQLGGKPLDLSEGRRGIVSYDRLPDLRSGVRDAFTAGVPTAPTLGSIGGGG